MSQIETEDRDQKLVRLHAQLSAAMLERGLQHARRDDPHLYARAEKSLLSPGARFELRAGVSPESGKVTTRGVVCDDSGDLIEVFSIVAAAGVPQ